MKCPNDDNTLVMTDRQGVEIDYCPVCRGVWLDRGELDKIIERSSSSTPVGQANTADLQREEYSQRQGSRDYDDHNSKQYNDGKKKKKESFLGDLFDF